MTPLTCALPFILACAGCKSKEEKCIETCEKSYTVRADGCSSPTQPEPALCRKGAQEGRWMCRKGCGITEPHPFPEDAPTSKPAPAPSAPPRVPFESALSKVCDGTGEPMAAAYDGAKGKHNAAIVFYKKAEGDKFIAQTIGDDYKSIGAQSGSVLHKADEYALVVCVAVKDHKMVKECPIKDHVVELHDATLEIRVLEARTAKVLAASTPALKHELKSCPSAWTFWSKRDISLPLHSKAVLEAATKLVDP